MKNDLFCHLFYHMQNKVAKKIGCFLRKKWSVLQSDMDLQK